MELRQLGYFQVVARLENMTAAAEELHIAQPSLSKSIAHLEAELGVKLFDRVGKRIKLNEYGTIFLVSVERIFRELDYSKYQLTHLIETKENSVTIGASSSKFLQELFQEFFLQHPTRRFKIAHITQQQELEAKLLDGEVDLGIFYTPMRHPEIACQPLLTEEIYLAVPPNHALAHRKNIHLSEVAEEPFISVTSDYAFGEMTKLFCREAGFDPDVAFEIESFDFIIQLVHAGFGVTFVPQSWTENKHQKSLPLLTIDLPTCQRTIWLSWLKNRYQTPITQGFKKFATNYFEQKKSQT
jgi:DNA-binding transcriptional LysR family regulator